MTEVSCAFPRGEGGEGGCDGVAWGYARAASALGIDIVENCAVTDLWIENGAVRGVETTRGTIRAERVGLAAAGATPGLAAMAGVTLPIHTYALQAFVSEPVKPCLDTVLLYLGTGTYVSQSDKGELVFGNGLDRVPTHGQRGKPVGIFHLGAVRQARIGPACVFDPSGSRLHG